MSNNKESSNSSAKPIDWAHYGLDTNESYQQRTALDSGTDTTHLVQDLRSNELFLENQDKFDKQWWKSNFFLSKPILFGTWDGVYTSCVIHLFGVITFLRAGWLVGNAGIGYSILIILSSVFICSLAALAAIGIFERHGSGNVHVLISNVLGSRIGGSVSIIYSFGHAVSCALHVMGFAETFSQFLKNDEIWIERGIGAALVLLLMVINILGVKWVIRLQFILLFFLFLSAIDFIIGVMIRYDPSNGVIGFSIDNIKENWEPNKDKPKLSLFNVFGVFFPAVTGVMAGINMSGDLYKPNNSIPIGTFSAIGTCILLYLAFVLGLGATCVRSSLLTDYTIAQKASSVGIFLLLGLYISSLSYSLGSLYATPRIIQNIANENIIPFKCLGIGRGPNKVPIYALILFSLVTLVFIMIGNINMLAPIVTIPYLMTYATVEYAYFSLAMTFDIQIHRESRFMASAYCTSPTFDKSKKSKHSDYGSVKSNDLDKLFPERVQTKHIKVKRQISSQSSSRSSSIDHTPDPQRELLHDQSGTSSADESYDSTDSSMAHELKVDPNEIKGKQNIWYSCLINRWIIIFGAIIKVVIMFLVQWGYALSSFIALLLLWYYMGAVNPGLFPGITEFKIYPWIKSIVLKCFGIKVVEYDQMVVPTGAPNMQLQSDRLTQANTDFMSREPYHQSSTCHYKTSDNLTNNK
ncbi:solute carrier family 12 member 8-like [Oppia nitens]|uniref:solute carrier family 12 member 8-like n=1 Tax=Oppia nitens TaxID=1686743 RepID=UPI0023DADEA8|nr:solute carrier family 12 member 8-like [Oppia nitens]